MQLWYGIARLSQSASLDCQYSGHCFDFGIQGRAAVGAEKAFDWQTATAYFGVGAETATLHKEAINWHQDVYREGTARLFLAVLAMADRSGQRR